VAALQVAHRRFTNLLHDLSNGDLEREGADPELGSYAMRQILEMATAHYVLRAQQVAQIEPGTFQAGGLCRPAGRAQSETARTRELGHVARGRGARCGRRTRTGPRGTAWRRGWQLPSIWSWQ